MPALLSLSYNSARKRQPGRIANFFNQQLNPSLVEEPESAPEVEFLKEDAAESIGTNLESNFGFGSRSETRSKQELESVVPTWVQTQVTTKSATKTQLTLKVPILTKRPTK